MYIMGIEATLISNETAVGVKFADVSLWMMSAVFFLVVSEDREDRFTDIEDVIINTGRDN